MQIVQKRLSMIKSLIDSNINSNIKLEKNVLISCEMPLCRVRY